MVYKERDYYLQLCTDSNNEGNMADYWETSMIKTWHFNKQYYFDEIYNLEQKDIRAMEITALPVLTMIHWTKHVSTQNVLNKYSIPFSEIQCCVYFSVI